ncbi:transcriptional regulator [Brevibacillus laterosporus]|nr:transcriptional regulator [Brevibacillus laterosporus]
MDSFLSMDYLLQFLRQVENKDIKLVIYDVIIDYSRQRGIPYYLSKTLFNRYQIERDDFSRFEETYHRAKEILNYTNFLHPTERILLYYRLGVHAYILGYFKECITLCDKGVFEDQADSREKASALISMINSYIRLGDLDLAYSYLQQYEKSQYIDYRKKHLQALLFGKNQQYEKAVTLFKECLKEAEQDVHISIVSDLLEVYLESGNNTMIENLIEQEDQFLSSKTIDHPYRIQLAARYYKRKGTCLLAINKIEEGSKSLMQSISLYRQLGASKQIVECTCILLKYHCQNETNLSFEYMELYSKICNNV